jgi:acyl dehydratase
MRTVPYAALPGLVGQVLGTSAWLVVDQARIDRFADATGDHQWIHVDVARATRERGGTIAHGFLTLSLLPQMAHEILHVEGVAHGLNYGLNRLRFISPVPAGARIRLHQTLLAVEERAGGLVMTRESTVEIEAQPRPALVAESLGLVVPA